MVAETTIFYKNIIICVEAFGQGLTARQKFTIRIQFFIQISLTMLESIFRASIIIVVVFVSCNGSTSEKSEDLDDSKLSDNFKMGLFGYDHQFLSKFDSIILLKSRNGEAQVIVSSKYQGKVFTSTAEGNNGRSFGWINYKAFTNSVDTHMNAYGGENRLWLGPEGGPFSLYFPEGADMSFENWKVPAPIDTEPWSINAVDSFSVHLQKNGTLKNYAGTTLQFAINRDIRILDLMEMEKLIGGEIARDVHSVGYSTHNTITNAGKNDWNEKSGTPCIWILDMFPPTAETTIIIPYKESSTSSKAITTNYFGDIPADRIKMEHGTLFFKADGKHRGKLGIAPSAAKNFAGSFDAKSNVLTITFFTIDSTGKYLNQEWTTKKLPFSGDAVNAYNDGPLANGNQLGPFYEIESVAPAAFLKAGSSSFSHEHTVLHFTGPRVGLNDISLKVFGISLDQIEKALK